MVLVAERVYFARSGKGFVCGNIRLNLTGSIEPT